MKAVRGARLSLLAICSWIVISNHCAFAAVATKTDSVQTECPFHSKPAQQKQDPRSHNAAKFYAQLFSLQTKSWARDDDEVFRCRSYAVRRGQLVALFAQRAGHLVSRHRAARRALIRGADFAAERSRSRSAGCRLTNREDFRDREASAVAAGVPPAFHQTVAADTAATTEDMQPNAETDFYSHLRNDARD